MNGFIDIHTHILPGVDDGAPELPQALQLLQSAWEDGTRGIVLTPHYRGHFKKNTPAMLQEKFVALQAAAASVLPDMQLYLGQEVAYEHAVPEALQQGRVLRLNGSRYVLLEFQSSALRSLITSGVIETLRNGFVPILAHVERCDIIRRSPDFLEELLRMGALLQMNASGILGKNGFFIKLFCHKLLKNKLVHFVASDTHSIQRRPPFLRACYEIVSKKYGEHYAAKLFWENPETVLENRSMTDGHT